MNSTATDMFSLRCGDVFIGRHAHTEGKVLRIEGAEGPWFLVRHRGSSRATPIRILPTTLFSSWELVSDERGAELFPWAESRSVVHTSPDMPEPKTRTRRKPGGNKPAAKRTKLEPSTGNVSATPGAPSTVAHEPPAPPPAPEPVANDTGVMALAKVFSSTLETITKQNSDQIREMSERINKMDQDRRREAEAMRETINTVARLVETSKAAPAQHVVAPAPVPTKPETKDTVKLQRHMQVFESLVPEFVEQCLVSVDMRDPSQRARALEGNEAHKMFVEWCANGKRASEVPYEHAFYALMKRIPNARHREEVKRNGKIRVLLPWAAKNPEQVEILFSDEPEATPEEIAAELTLTLDAGRVFQFAAANLWPGLAESYMNAIKDVLRAGPYDANDVITALTALARGIPGSTHKYSADKILTVSAITTLANYAEVNK